MAHGMDRSMRISAAAACHGSAISPAHINQASLKAHPLLFSFSSSATLLSAISSVVAHSSLLQTYSSTISTEILRFRACCLVFDQAIHDPTEQMGHEQQQEVPCKQQQMTATLLVLDSNPAVTMRGWHGSKNIS
jgi:hypothetical protein